MIDNRIANLYEFGKVECSLSIIINFFGTHIAKQSGLENFARFYRFFVLKIILELYKFLAKTLQIKNLNHRNFMKFENHISVSLLQNHANVEIIVEL